MGQLQPDRVIQEAGTGAEAVAMVRASAPDRQKPDRSGRSSLVSGQNAGRDRVCSFHQQEQTALP